LPVAFQASTIDSMAVLYSWLGMSDMRLIGAADAEDHERGPLFQALADRDFRRLVLLCNATDSEAEHFKSELITRLARKGKVLEVKIGYFDLSDPTDYSRIYHCVRELLDREYRLADDSWFHLSPGTPAMASVWMVLSQSSHPARLIQTSREQGLREVELPFVLEARARGSLSALVQDLMDGSDTAGEFSRISYSEPVMARIIEKARRAARFDIPVLISGESGTGKELLSRAIHHASPRKDGPFVPVNCGAIPADLMESQFFGHVKGAFTGAESDRQGVFEEARGGTLFLDEIGELPPAMQVKLLRALQEGEVRPVGADRSRSIDVRIVAATNRHLPGEIAAGRFRPDLYYRLAVAGLGIPPLRQRPGDIPVLVRRLMSDINREFAAADPAWEERDLSAGAMDFISAQPWPGNVRQLLNSLKQAVLWSHSLIIESDDLIDLLSPETIADAPQAGAYLQEELDALARRRIEQALGRNRGHKARTAEELGFANHQTLTNWMSRLGIDYTA
jgi:DNA-binding NtrC family response regulator